MSDARSLESVAWRGKLCRGYILLLTNHTTLHAFMSQPDGLWDFKGKFVVVGVSREELQELASSRKGVKTEHFIGIVKQGRKVGQWAVYTSILYRSGPGNLHRVATWSNTLRNSLSSSNLVDSHVAQFADHLKDLFGIPLKVVTFEFEPSVLYYRDSSGKVEFPFGIDIEVVNALARTLNFTIIFEEPPKGELWGVEGDDGEWTGMVGRLARGEADIGVANLFLTLTRLGAVDYSAPYDAEVSCFLVRSDPAVPRWMSLVLPFQFTTWGAILVGVLVTGVFLYVFAVAAYCSNLTAFLTVTHRPQGINTIRSLHAAHMEVSGLGSFFKGALASAVDPYLQGLAKRFVPYQELDLVWNQVKEGHAAYLHNRQFLEFVIATQFTSTKGESSMRIMKECFAPYSIAMALQRNSPLKKKFDHVISWMLASGLVRHWFLESLRLSRKCSCWGRFIHTETLKSRNIPRHSASLGSPEHRHLS
ncbi:Glutamate receptor ionotropic, delta-1 [Portunus trituberculatus]|uniref:Glutamate receptor ionotropic, delta-1 n=1 Tax=Portunus trituberculatus TaxID=210409 RepID=A0A5B7D1Q2_PORTR|nr:Glutamate receptor ionotropic, delta-1 [Portunus trituberculatus]